MRAPVQVSVIAYHCMEDPPQVEYLILRRCVEQYWQWIHGGVEAGETMLEAIRREAFEEAAVSLGADYVQLQTQGCVPKHQFSAHREWPAEVMVVPIHYFSVACSNRTVQLSREHTEYRWADYQACLDLLKWDSDKTALWELNTLLTG